MALIVQDRVKVNTTTTGTGTIVLAATAPTGYQSFAVIGNNNTTYYTIAGQTTSEWEVGIGTYYLANSSLSRDTILASSAANATVTFSAGTKDVFVTYPAERAIYANATGSVVFTDSTFFLQDEADPTKQAQFQLSGLAANNSVVYTLPAGSANASTLVDLATAQTLNGVKTFSNPTQNYGSSTANSTVNIAYGATLATNNKTINIGTGGVSGALVNVTIGQANTVVNTTAWGNVTVKQLLTVGANAALGGATNPIVAMTGNANNYIQGYIYNLGNLSQSSADLVVYPINGTDSAGWVDMGITGPIYNQAIYSVTGANEGYVFMSAPAASGTSGNLVFATDSTGIFNSMQFYTGGFAQTKANVAMTLSNAGTLVVKGSIKANSTGFIFPDNTTQTTAATPGLTAAGNSSIAIFNTNITANATIADGTNGLSVGPVNTANGVVVTIGANATWVTL
jgi:hypothetical protein